MLKNAKLTTGTLWLVAWICCQASVAWAQDRVYPKQGVPASGKIATITPTEVIITVRGKDQTYAMTDVRKVSFDGEPNMLDRVREQMLLGQHEQALEEVKKISPAGIENPLAVQDVEFYRWYGEGKMALAGKGDKNAAIAGLLALARKNGNTHQFYPLVETLGELSLAVGQLDKATNFFNMLAKSPSAEAKATALYQLGQVELSQGKTAEAKERFKQLAAAPSNSPELIRLKNFAAVGLAVCENLDGNPQAALDNLNALIQKNDSTDQVLFARINNAKGACYQALKQPESALLRYLQTDLLFFTSAEAHAEALYQLSVLWPAVGDPARGAEAKSRLVQQYASSSWANK
jgi:tetratricopeptide (TPR) repeat protein